MSQLSLSVTLFQNVVNLFVWVVRDNVDLIFHLLNHTRLKAAIKNPVVFLSHSVNLARLWGSFVRGFRCLNCLFHCSRNFRQQ